MTAPSATAPPGLKRVLGLPAVTCVAIGFTIGGGVFVFTGIVYNFTGRALPLAYALAVIPVFMSMLPLAMLGAALPATGGNYVYPSRMVSPGLAFVGVWVYALASFFGQIPLYALGCARYAQFYFPGLPAPLCAAALVTFFYAVNLMGVRPAARLQGALVVVLLAALACYAAAGLARPALRDPTPLLDCGAANLLLGTALLTFTYFGSNAIVELGGEIVDPGRVIPRAFFLAFPVVALVYIAVAVVTVEVLAGRATGTEEPLLQVSRVLLGGRGTVFFVFGGAILALTTTLNALFMVGSKSLLTIVADGILPERLGTLSPRFGTPHTLLTVIWLLSLAGIFSGFSLETLAAYAALGALIIFLPVQVAALRLPRCFPHHYHRAPFKLQGLWFWACPATGMAMIAFFGSVILYDLKSVARIGSFLLFVLSGALYYHLRRAHLARRGIDLVARIRGETWHA